YQGLGIRDWATCARSPKSLGPSPQHNQRHLPRPADHCIPFLPEYIDFRAYPKSVEVKAGLDSKACPGQNPPIVVRLVVVQMHAVSMDRFAEAMPSAVKNGAAIPRLLDHVRRRRAY